MNHPLSLLLLQGPVLVPGLVGLCALSPVAEDHRREPGVMDRYRGRDAIIILVSPGLHGPPAAPHADQGRGPGAEVMVIQNRNNAAPLLVSLGHHGPPVAPHVDQGSLPGEAVTVI